MLKKQALPVPDSRGLYKTFNKMGFMTSEIDPYIADFITQAASPFLDIGCAFGQTILFALLEEKEVIANDSLLEHLEVLKTRIDPSKKKNIQFIEGNFPNKLEFSPNSLGSILACRVLHFLKGEEIIEGCHKAYHWLRKDGLFCIASETPYRKNLSEFLPIFEERKKKTDRFPGLIEDVKKYWPNDYQNLPPWLNLLDEDIINSVLEEAGFRVVFSKSYKKVIELEHVAKGLPNYFISIGKKI